MQTRWNAASVALVVVKVCLASAASRRRGLATHADVDSSSGASGDWSPEIVASHDDETFPAGPTGIDEQRIREAVWRMEDAIRRLEQVADELGWPTVLRVYADIAPDGDGPRSASSAPPKAG